MTAELPQLNDVTLRGSFQAVHPNQLLYPNEAVVFGKEQQLQIARSLNLLGSERIELLAPVENSLGLEIAKEIVHQNKELNARFSADYRFALPEVCIHSRCDINDLNWALATEADRINLYLGTSDELRKANGKDHPMTPEEIVGKATEAIEYIHKNNPNTKIRFSTEDAFRTKREELLEIISKIAANPNVDTIGIPDTTGLAYPNQVYELITQIRNLPQMQGKKIEVHFHNDRGMAVANCWMAWLAGAEVFNTSILGLEERNGIPPLASFFAAFDNEGLVARGFLDKYDATQVPQIDSLVAGMLGIVIPHTSPITAFGANKQVSGVHGSATLKNGAYAAFPLAHYGIDKQEYIYASRVIGARMVANRMIELGLISDMSKAPDIDTLRQTASHLRLIALQNGRITLEEVDNYLKRFV